MKILTSILKIILVIVLQCLIISPLTAAELTILPPDASLGRIDPVLANNVYVRVHSVHDLRKFIQLSKSYGIKNISPLLSNEQAGFNYKDRNALSDNKYRAMKIAEDKLLRTFIAEYERDVPPEEFAAKLNAECSIVELAEPFYIPSVTGAFIPDDSLVGEQKMLETIQAFEAWGISKGDKTIVIGISDSGILQQHEDLFDNLWTNENEIPGNYIDDDNNGYIDDYKGYNFGYLADTTEPGNTFCISEGHGTGTAGISSAVTDNKKGIAGTAFNCSFFPMKTYVNYKNGIIYGYQSIIYSAIMGFDVVNCSWGGFNYSCVNESIIDYALSKGVVIVTGSGNHGNVQSFYPASYSGVIGVGVSNPRDTVIGMSSFGPHCHIIAPGQETRTTSNDSTYGTFCCTSGAAPIVSAAVALAKSVHPELDNYQLAAFIKQCTDDISEQNPDNVDMLPGRVNLRKALSLNPYSMIATEAGKMSITDSNALEMTKYDIGDTLYLRMLLENRLAPADSISIRMRIISNNDEAVEIIDSSIQLGKIVDAAEAVFRIIKKESTELPLMIRFDVYNSDRHCNFFLKEFIIEQEYKVFANKTLRASVGDNLRIGYASPFNSSQGIGFNYLNYCNILFESGLIASEKDGNVVSQTRDDIGYADDFRVKIPFSKDRNYAIVRDSDTESPIGLEIRADLSANEKDLPCMELNLRMINISGTDLEDVALGYFFDWDIGPDGDSNTVLLFDDAVLEEYKANSQALMIFRNNNWSRVGVLVYSPEEQAEMQAQSYENYLTYDDNGFSDAEKYESLNSGIVLTEYSGDISLVQGVRFPGIFRPYDVKNMKIYICAAENEQNLLSYLMQVQNNNILAMENISKANTSRVYPNPASDYINIKLQGSAQSATASIYTLQGKLLLRQELNGGTNRVELSDYSSGAYLLTISSCDMFETVRLEILR